MVKWTKNLIIFGVLLLMNGSQLSGYAKFKFMDRPAKNIGSMAMRIPFCLKKADYSFFDAREGIKNYVFLTTADRKKIEKELASYDKKLSISSEMILKFKATGRLNNNMVGLILQDFKAHHPNITIGQLLDTLKK